VAPVPKPRETRQRWAKRPEIGLVRVDPADKPVIPKPPAGLLKKTRDRWEAYWLSPVSKAVDLGADGGRLERWIRAVDEWHRAGEAFRSARVVKGSMSQPVLNPLAAYLATIETTLARAEQELGLTPMARAKLGIVIGQEALTADAINRSLSRHDDSDPHRDAIDAEWSEAT
jgi:P27 family predicted phage terminase small subunit